VKNRCAQDTDDLLRAALCCHRHSVDPPSPGDSGDLSGIFYGDIL